MGQRQSPWFNREKWGNVIASHPKHAIVIGFVFFIGSSLLIYLGVRAIYRWGFTEFGWESAIALVGIVLLLVLWLAPVALVAVAVIALVEGLDAKIQKTLDEARKRERQLDQELARSGILASLIPVVKYSRIQLDTFYTITVGQTRKSFRYAVLAMWAGFLILAASLIRALGIWNFGLRQTTSTDTITIVSTASGIIIEVVSALFLWIYRSTINQFNYLYARQFAIHGVLLAFGVASSMEEKAEEAKLGIVSEILKGAWSAPPSPLDTKERKAGEEGAAASPDMGKATS